jgi:hypothetical protein
VFDRKTVVKQGLRFEITTKRIPSRPLYLAYHVSNPDGSTTRFGNPDSLLDWINEGYVQAQVLSQVSHLNYS